MKTLYLWDYTAVGLFELYDKGKITKEQLIHQLDDFRRCD